MEFADVERSPAQPRNALDRALDRLGDLIATSDAPAPGYGATTVMTGKSMSGSSSCLSEPQAEMPARNRANASSRVTLRWLIGELGTGGSRVPLRDRSRSGADQDVHCFGDACQLVSAELLEKDAQRFLAQLLKAVQESDPMLVSETKHMAAIDIVCAPSGKPVLDQSFRPHPTRLRGTGAARRRAPTFWSLVERRGASAP